MSDETKEYYCKTNLDLYDRPNCQSLATQAAAGRHLRLLPTTRCDLAVKVYLCEDGYTAWLPIAKLTELNLAKTIYCPISLSRSEIERRLPEIIAFTKTAMARPNYYLWGGTVGPNYDCSGLIQAAFAASGVWLPRDSYQQAAFTKKIDKNELEAADLIFFAKRKRVDHVALYLGDGYYIHSSGKEIGRNGIGIDGLTAEENPISQAYYQQLWGFGRVISSYQPKSIELLG
ncbi:C40 family peptidase [Pleurocapsales cyanobacterium LEGE 06147]|nr:C40 family peptidase [Pleurocapsales cyanobacterium LEGE 06147]